jgi:hypothetical protein
MIFKRKFLLQEIGQVERYGLYVMFPASTVTGEKDFVHRH